MPNKTGYLLPPRYGFGMKDKRDLAVQHSAR